MTCGPRLRGGGEGFRIRRGPFRESGTSLLASWSQSTGFAGDVPSCESFFEFDKTKHPGPGGAAPGL